MGLYRRERIASGPGRLYSLAKIVTTGEEREANSRERLRFTAEPRDVLTLLTGEGAPLLSVSRVSFTYGDRPVELRRGLYDTSTHHYRNRLS